MLKADVEIGGVYRATISGKRVDVQILREVERRGYGKSLSTGYKKPTTTGWVAKNLSTGKEVTIKSAQKLTAIPKQQQHVGPMAKSREVVGVATEATKRPSLASLFEGPPETLLDPSDASPVQGKGIPVASLMSFETDQDQEDEAPFEPTHFEPVKPVGRTPTEEQRLILEEAKKGHRVMVIEAGAGCLAGDTVIWINRGKKGSKARIDRVVEQFKGLATRDRWNPQIPTYVARAVDGVFRLGLLKNAWFSGNKLTYRVTTETGREIRATSIHPFLKSDGSWCRLSGLKVGDRVKVNVGKSKKGRDSKVNYVWVDTRFHPNQVVNIVERNRFKVVKHRLMVEADMNNLSFDDYVKVLRTDELTASSFNYLTSEQIVHHKDENVKNNTLSNLEVTTFAGHYEYHDNWGNNCLERVGDEAIVSIEKYGVEPTYDLEVEDDPHNFCANGFVVHNTGKTTTLRMLADVLKGNGQYTAFNSSLVQESKSKFAGTRVACNTTHSLGFRSEGAKYSHRLNGPRMRSAQIAELLGLGSFEIKVSKIDTEDKTISADGKKILSSWFLAGQVMRCIARFCQSDDQEIEHRHFKYIDGIDFPDEHGRTSRNNHKVREYLLPFAEKAWADLSSLEGQLPFSHDHYVKIWQLHDPVIAGHYVLLDEGQDTAPVMLDVIKQQTMPVIIVQDSCQQIYEWRGAVNAAKAFGDVPTLYLSQSFRFGPAIAAVANAILAELDEPSELKLKGLPSIDSKVITDPNKEMKNPDCVLTRTNATAISFLLQSLNEKKKPYLVGGGADTISFVEAAQKLQQLLPVQHQDLACFNSWVEVQEYAKTDEGEDLKLMVKLIDGFGVEVILKALKEMSSEKDADITICTAHKSKGREWNKVKIANDFPTKSKCADSDRRLLYVACTRAKLELDVSMCPFFSGQDSMDLTDVIKNLNIAKPVQTVAAAPVVVGYTWTKKDDAWVVRGPSGNVGKSVSVSRKDGSSQNKTLRRVLEESGPVSIYSV